MSSPLKITILSLFPRYFDSPLGVSLMGRAIQKGRIEVERVDIRDFAEGPHRQVDDRPYGGGPGMVLMAEPIMRALRACRREDSHVVYLSPRGQALNPFLAREYSKRSHLILLCGHYEGVDHRIFSLKGGVDEEISVGNYILSSGCPAALSLMDTVVRFVPGVMGNSQSGVGESSREEGGQAPAYTRPVSIEGEEVPSLLLQGNHQHIQAWRQAQRSPL
ncbi:MAG: tRNA (guanosine(37)-N1)-methyltransferase TrmD [Chlamydiota bacterium]|nr:tRNA (guanosine(37)-N1)-methyltransferase TrmD [Chlamydiota bacterium]